MKISIFCDGKMVDFEVTEKDASIFIFSTKEYLKSDKYAESVYGKKKYTDEELSNMTVDDVMKAAFGSTDYNSWHKQDRHTDKHISYDESIQGQIQNVRVKSVDELVIDKEKKEAVKNFVYSNLQKSQADVYYMRVIEGMEFHEIAESLKDYTDNVSHRFYRAEKHLRKIFEKILANPSKKGCLSGYLLESLTIPKEK